MCGEHELGACVCVLCVRCVCVSKRIGSPCVSSIRRCAWKEKDRGTKEKKQKERECLCVAHPLIYQLLQWWSFRRHPKKPPNSPNEALSRFLFFLSREFFAFGWAFFEGWVFGGKTHTNKPPKENDEWWDQFCAEQTGKKGGSFGLQSCLRQRCNAYKNSR